MSTLSRRNALLLLSAAPMALQSAQGQQPAASPIYAQTDPALNAHLNLPVPANLALPTLFLVGDSTVRNGRGDGANNQMGWGEPLVAFFDAGKINVLNRAIGGRSSRTYLTEGHWADVLSMLKPGDTVLFQFGHNDTGAPDEPTRARASLPGVGDEILEINNPITKKPETVHTFGWYMTNYVKDTLTKSATPILCSLIPRKIWNGEKIVRADDNFGGWTRQVAQTQRVGFIDLNHIVADRYDKMGPAAVEPLFGDPHTHTTLAGAQLNAECVVAGLKALKHNPVAADFSPAAAAIKSATPSTA